MSGVILAAKTAFELSSVALQQAGMAPVETSSTSASFLDHWPAATAGLCCLITAVNAVALTILGNAALGILLGVAAIGCAVLTFYLRNAPTLRHLSTYVDAFAQNVSALAKQVIHFQSENKELTQTRVEIEAAMQQQKEQFEKQKAEMAGTQKALDQTNVSLNGIVQQREKQLAEQKAEAARSLETLKQLNAQLNDTVQQQGKRVEGLTAELARTQVTLTQTKTAFEALVQQQGKQFEEQKVSTAQAIADLDRVTGELTQTKGQVSEMKKTIDGLHAVLSELSSKTESFVALNRESSTTSQRLAAALPAIKAIRDRFQTSVSALELQDQALVEGIKKAQAIVQKICEQCSSLAQLVIERKAQTEAIERDADTLRADNTQLASQAAALHSTIDDLKRGTAGAQKDVFDLKPLFALSEAMKKASKTVTVQPK